MGKDCCIFRRTARYVPAWFKGAFYYVLVNLLALSVLRLVFLFVFRTFAPQNSLREILVSLYIGMKFDLRLICLMALPLIIYLLLAYFWHPARRVKKAAVWLYSLASVLLLLIYFVDFGYYAYLSNRFNPFVLNFVQNPIISLQMVWESYHVVWGALALAVWGIISYAFIKKCVNSSFSGERRYGWKWNTLHIIVAVLITAACIYGQIAYYPLRWSNAYHSTNNFICDLTVNPVLNFYSTYIFAKKDGYDEAETRRYYDTVAQYLGVDKPDKEKLNYNRDVPSVKGKPVRDYNIVFIFMESLAWNKSSLSQSALDSTPFVKELASQSLLLSHFFTPTPATARAVFATSTSIPDTSTVDSSSRNPFLVDQKMIANELENYEKFYFIGGSANWGNIRGLLTHNLDNFHMYEEGDFTTENRNDVWGISDLDLMRQADAVFAKQTKPFMAYIQTAGYHRPYTIPADNAGFKPENPSEELVRKYSFGSVKEYNSMRFEDHVLGQLFKMAKKHDYYKKTIFVIYGDHGLAAPESVNMPRGYVVYNLINNQVPLIIHADFVKPQVVNKTASQLDMWPTVMSLLNKPYSTGALGRNILDPKYEEGAFIYGLQQPNSVNFVHGNLYYMNKAGDEGMYDVSGDSYKVNLKNDPKYGKELEHLRQLASGYYETARYIKYHNRKNGAAAEK